MKVLLLAFVYPNNLKSVGCYIITKVIVVLKKNIKFAMFFIKIMETNEKKVVPVDDLPESIVENKPVPADDLPTPLKKKDQNLPLTSESTSSSDTTLLPYSPVEEPKKDRMLQNYEQNLKPVEDGAQPQIKSVDLTSVKDIDPVLLKSHIDTNIQGSINSKKDAQALLEQKQNELVQLQEQANQLAQQFEQSDEAGKLQIEAQIKELTSKIPEYDLAINQANEEINKQNKIISYQSNIRDAIDKPKEEELSFLESIKNTGENIGTQLQGVIPRLNIASADIWEGILGKELAGKWYGWEGRDINQVREDSYKKLAELEQQVKPTEGILGNIREGNISGLAAGIVDAVGGLVGTVVPALATGGAELFIDPIGESIVNYNNVKAKKEGVSVKELYESGNAELGIPAAIGTLSGSMEMLGLKGISQAINRKIASGGLKFATDIFLDTNKEGLTEVVQLGLDSANKALAEGKSAKAAADEAADSMLSDKGLEVYLKGVAGAGVAAGGGHLINGTQSKKEIIQPIEGSADAYTPKQPNVVEELLTSEGDKIDVQNKKVFDKIQEFKANPQSEEQFQERLRAEMELGEITPEQVDQANQVLGAVQTLDEKVPNNISDPSIRLAAINLLAERIDIERSIELADKALTIPQQDRIKIINEQLGALSQGATIDEALNINQLKTAENGNKETKIGVGTTVQEPNQSTEQKSENIQPEIGSGGNREEQVRQPENAANGESRQEEITNQKPQENAIQEQATTESVLRNEGVQRQSELQGVRQENQPKVTAQQSEEKPQEKEHKLAERVEKSELTPDIKKRLKEKGTTYITKSVEMSKKEANEIIKNYSDAGELDELENFALNQTSDIKGDVRTVLLVQLATKYTNLSAIEVNPELREQYVKKAVDILYAGQKFGEQAGRTLNAHKEWQTLTGKNPETAVAGVQKELDNRNAPVLDKYSNVIKDAQTLLRQLLETEEGKSLIEEKVKEALKNQKGRKNIFTRTAQERKEKIAELKAKFKEASKDTASSSIIGLNSKQIEAAVELGAEYLASGVVNFAKWSQKMINELGLTEEQAKAVWDEGEIENEKFSDYAEKTKIENNKKRAERLKEKLSTLDVLIKNPEKAIAELESKKKILEGRDASPEEIRSAEQQIKERKKLIELSQKLGELDDSKRKKILGESIDSIIKNGYLGDIAFKNIFAKALGLDYLTDQDVKNIKDFATTIKEAEVLGEKFLENPSKENQTAYKVAIYKARQANAKLSEYFKKPKTLFGLLSTFIQGNLLTPISQVTNIYANANMIPLRFAKKAVASATDWALSQGAKLNGNKKYERTHDVIANMKGSFPGAWAGLKEGVKQLRTGALPEDVANRDLSTSLHPITAIKSFYDGLKGEEKKAFTKHLNDLTEGTLGIPPEIMFRLLNLGDKPFRRAAQSGALREQAAIRSLKGEELTKFLQMPPEEVADLVEQLGQEATFQDSNFISDWLRSKSPKNKLVGDIIKFLTVSQAPYVKTPVNIALETFQYAVPVIPLAKSIYFAKNGNKRLALDNWGKAMTGFVILYTVNLLIKNGILSGEEEEEKKKRNAQYLYDKPNMINLSALDRLMTGGNPKPKDGDHKIDIKKLGIVGSVMAAAQHVQSSKEGKEINNSMLENMALMIPSTLKSSFDQSFLSGTNTLLNAMQGEDYDLRKWLISTSNTFGAAILPNTVSTISKIDDDYFRDTRDVELGQNIINNYKNKLFKGNELPKLVNMWGEPIKNVPKDRNSWVYYLLDVTKGEKVDKSQFGVQIYDLYKKTNNDEVLPTPIARNITIKGEKINLNPTQYEVLCTFIGQSRKANVQALLLTDEWNEYDDKKKIELLKKAYSQGRKNGITKFKQATDIVVDIED